MLIQIDRKMALWGRGREGRDPMEACTKWITVICVHISTLTTHRRHSTMPYESNVSTALTLQWKHQPHDAASLNAFYIYYSIFIHGFSVAHSNFNNNNNNNEIIIYVNQFISLQMCFELLVLYVSVCVWAVGAKVILCFEQLVSSISFE